MLKNQTLGETIKGIMDDPLNVWYYIQGTVRMWLYNNYPILLRPHIIDQFEWRKKRALKCSKNKSCLACGCKTDDLFFADKACSLSKIDSDEKRIFLAQRKTVCYPKMLGRKEWFNKKIN